MKSLLNIPLGYYIVSALLHYLGKYVANVLTNMVSHFLRNRVYVGI